MTVQGSFPEHLAGPQIWYHRGAGHFCQGLRQGLESMAASVGPRNGPQHGPSSAAHRPSMPGAARAMRGRCGAVWLPVAMDRRRPAWAMDRPMPQPGSVGIPIRLALLAADIPGVYPRGGSSDGTAEGQCCMSRMAEAFRDHGGPHGQHRRSIDLQRHNASQAGSRYLRKDNAPAGGGSRRAPQSRLRDADGHHPQLKCQSGYYLTASSAASVTEACVRLSPSLIRDPGLCGSRGKPYSSP